MPFLDGARLSYDDPDIGDLVSFFGALGLVRASGTGSGTVGVGSLTAAEQIGILREAAAGGSLGKGNSASVEQQPLRQISLVRHGWDRVTVYRAMAHRG